MYTVIASVALAAVTFAAVYAAASDARYGWVWALGAALAVGVGAYAASLFYVNQQLKARLSAVETALAGGRADQAIQLLEAMRPFGKWQLMIDRVIDGQIGVILYAHKQDFERARPYLEGTLANNWVAKAMLGAYHFQRRDDEAMARVFEEALKVNRKESMLWAAYAWCVWKRGNTKDAVNILERAHRALPDDERIAKNLSTLKNNNKLKMNGYEPEWFLLHLQRMPVEVIGGGRRGGGIPMGVRPAGTRVMGGRRPKAR